MGGNFGERIAATPCSRSELRQARGRARRRSRVRHRDARPAADARGLGHDSRRPRRLGREWPRRRRRSIRCSAPTAQRPAGCCRPAPSASTPTARCSRSAAAPPPTRSSELSTATPEDPGYNPLSYSYNFGPLNYLQLPINRKQVSAFLRYELFPEHAEIYSRLMFTTFNSDQQLASTPVTCSGTALGCSLPVTNTAIPADLRALLELAHQQHRAASRFTQRYHRSGSAHRRRTASMWCRPCHRRAR